MDNKKLKIIIIILSVIILGLISYIICDKILNNNDTSEINNNENNNNENNNNEDEINDQNLIQELKDIFKFVYDYYDTGNAYCGEFNRSDSIDGENPNGYWASTTYTTYNQMIEDLKKYMSEEIIYNKYSMKKENYIEQNGKLYCGDFGKGGNIYQPENIVIKIDKQQENKIYSAAKLELSTVYDAENIYYNYNIIFEKNNDNWIITSYEKID